MTASDGLGGTATQMLTLDAVNQAPVVATKTADQANEAGATVTPVDASRAFTDPNGDPLTYAATNLPAGLSIDPTTGRITGTVAANAQPARYQVAVTATDDKGTATTETFAWSIADVPTTTTGPLPAQHLADGQSDVSIETARGFSDANGNDLAFSASGLPAGLSIDSAGRITGTLDHDASKNAPAISGSGATLDGTYTVVVTARDSLGGTSTQSFTLDARNDPPVLGTNTASQKNTEGDAISVDAASAFADPNIGDVLTLFGR